MHISEAKPRWTIKDSVFKSLYSDPESRLALFQAIHPNVTDVTIDDIQDATIPHIFMNDYYNDLALLVKNILVIFIEVQSSWTYGILIRLILYWALYLQEYISANKLNLHHLGRQSLPKPEFYVIYTGGDHLTIQTLSLRKDFFQDPACPVDLTATIIHSSDKSNLLGQYIIFCQVYQEQYKRLGRSKAAMEETVRICKDDDVLKDFLTEHEKEVIDMVDVLFDPERQRMLDKRDDMIQATVKSYKSLGQTREATAKYVSSEYDIGEAQSEYYVDYFWDPKPIAFAL